MAKANFSYSIIDGIILIEDLGPWDKYKTVTNDIENVLSIIDQQLQLSYHKRIYEYQIIYIDSEGEYTGVYFDDGVFDRFVHIGPCESANEAISIFKSMSTGRKINPS